MATSPGRFPARRVAAALAAVVVLSSVAIELQAQFRRGFGGIRRATAQDHDGAFHFCRAIYRSDNRGDGGNWSVDCPRADINLTVRLGELTRAHISRPAASRTRCWSS